MRILREGNINDAASRHTTYKFTKNSDKIYFSDVLLDIPILVALRSPGHHPVMKRRVTCILR